jgi:endogenous inhibitor of DNA gyrase (YacG/DUF329 family)
LLLWLCCCCGGGDRFLCFALLCFASSFLLKRNQEFPRCSHPVLKMFPKFPRCSRPVLKTFPTFPMCSQRCFHIVWPCNFVFLSSWAKTSYYTFVVLTNSMWTWGGGIMYIP